MQTETPATPTGAPAAKATGRAAFVATMAAKRQAGPAADEAPPAALDATDEADAEEAAAASDETPPVTPPAAKEPALDAAATHRLAAAQKEERRRKEAATAERAAIKAEADKARAEIEEQRASVAAQAKAAKDFEALRERARSSPRAALEMLRSFGYDGDAFESIARAAWAETAEGKKHPANRAAAEQTMAQREATDAIAEAKREAAEAREEAKAIRKLIEERDAATANERMVNDYLDGVQKAADAADAPLVRQWAAKAPAKVRQQFHAVARELSAEIDGDAPDPAAVVAEVERRRRAELEEMGFDPAALLAPPKKPGAPPPKVLGTSTPAPSQPPRPLTPDERRAEFIRKKQAGKLDDK